jgi:DNA-binding NarL/FixJ family response regulator
MTLSSMVVSRDWQEVSILECILGGLQVAVAVENEPRKVLSRLSKSKIDALIVDCDLNGSSQLLRELQSPDLQPKAVPLVVMGGPQLVNRLDETGALFAFTKPISVEQAVQTLSAARSMILDGRLRYQRTNIDLEVSVKSKSWKAGSAQLVNLSQNGMQINTDRRLDAACDLQVSFELPGSRAGWKAQAQVVWQDQGGNTGLRFVKVAPRQQRTLNLWLAQQFLAN